ncbi:replication protein A 70 kDa DNA-binding subunit-like isoform X2 [Nelusetta ayraudi]|uniref:replication protein A 70 kDa DNA-binding subunit-like isoform X2 n=1 Tax=Nelusetta ayraudi TaxID=303726 RepID=UPI003F716654
MSVKLTEGAIEAFVNKSPVDNPVLQLLKIVDVSRSGPSRFRLLLSDGLISWGSFMLASQLNDLPQLVPQCICKLKRSVATTLSDGRTVFSIHDMEIVQSAEDTGGIIGSPTKCKGAGKTSSEPDLPSSTSSPTASAPFKTSQFDSKPGPSKRPDSGTYSSPHGSGRGFVEKSPMKDSSMMASPSKFSPMMASPSKFSPMKDSPSKSSPRMDSQSKFSPMKDNRTSPSSMTKVLPISNLNPYISKWTIRARVTNKSSIRNWSNSRGEGKLFSFEIVDESGEIKITAFNSEADKYYSLVEQGKVYYISKATLKVANKQYSKVNNDYEMTLHAHSSIVPCDDSHDIPTMSCDFVKIADLENRDKDAIIDVIGVCKSADDVSRITTRNSREVSKRTLYLVDTTGKNVAVTLWGEEAEKFDSSEHPVVAIKAARLSDFGGRSLSALFSSTVMVNPDLPEAFRLRAWYDHQGHALASQSLTDRTSAGSGLKVNWKTLSEVKDEKMGHGEKADYFSCVATLLYIRKETCLYKACPSGDCNKKVIDQHNGQYRCEKCNREFPNFKYRLLLSANLADFSDNQWVTCFQESAETLLGCSADTLGQLRDTDEDAFNEVFQKACYTTHIFRNRIKLETYNGCNVFVIQTRTGT